MKISHKRKMIALAAGTALAALVASGCAASQGSPPDTSSEGSDNVQKVLIGIRQDLYPTSYIDESGKPSGYDIEIIQKVDELLPGYEFEYEAVSQEALLTGLDTGKYAAAVAGFYHNPDRAAKYLFPQECIGGNVIGLGVRPEDEAITDLAALYESGKVLEPIATTSGMYGIVVDYNKNNPEKQVKLTDSDWSDAADQFKWIAEKRYDAVVTSRNVFNDTLSKIGLQDQLVFNPFTAIKTWSLFNPKETELAQAYDGAIKSLKEDGTVSELSVKYFGEDVLPYIQQ